MDDLFRDINNLICNENEGVIGIWTTSKINPQGISQKRVIAVSDFHVYVFKMKFLSTTLTMCKKYSLCSLKSMTNDPEKGAIFVFNDGRIVIKDPEVEDILLKTVYNQMCAFLTDEELPFEVHRTVQIDPILRLHYYMSRDQKFDQAVLSSLSQFVSSKPKTIVLSAFSGKTDAILPCLCFIRSVDKLVIDLPINQESGEYLTEYFNYVQCIKEVTFSSIIRVDFEPIIRDCSAKIKTVVFTDTVSGEFISKSVLAVLQKFSLSRIIFQNCLTAEIVQSISEVDKKSDPKTVHIIGSNNDLLQKIVASLPSTKRFRIEKHTDDIIEFLNNFTTSSISLESFEFIDCRMMMNFDFTKIPKIIKSISFINCVVNEEGMKLASKAAQNRIFFISGISIAEGCDEKSITKSFKDSISMQSLFFRWNKSYFNAEMFDLITKNQFDELILCDIFIKDTPLVKDLCKFIKETYLIKVLDISVSSSENSMKVEDVQEIIKALAMNNSIEKLSIDEYLLTKESLDILSQSLNANKIVTEIHFGCEKIDCNLLIDFFKSIQPRNQPIRYFWRGKNRSDSGLPRDVLDAWKDAENAKIGRKKSF
jgi:hypothetical protein